MRAVLLSSAEREGDDVGRMLGSKRLRARPRPEGEGRILVSSTSKLKIVLAVGQSGPYGSRRREDGCQVAAAWFGSRQVGSCSLSLGDFAVLAGSALLHPRRNTAWCVSLTKRSSFRNGRRGPLSSFSSSSAPSPRQVLASACY